MHNALDPYLE